MKPRELLLLSCVAFAISACGGSDSDPMDTGANGSGSDTGNTGTDNTGTETGNNGGTGSAGSNNSNTGGTTLFGTIDVDVSDQVVAEAVFFKTPQQLPQEAIDSEFRPELEVCDIFNSSDAATVGPSEIDQDQVQLIGAGEVITISSPAGSYLEILRQEVFGTIVYGQDENVVLSGPAPAGLTVNIPGDEFPEFSNIAIPSAQSLQVSSPGEFEMVNANTTFSWTPGNDQKAYIAISAISGTTVINCNTADDGSFTFPENAKAAFSSASLSFASMSRESSSLLQQGGAFLTVATSVSR